MPNSQTPDSAAPPGGAHATVILVVEDDEGVRQFVRLSLEQAGHVVVPAADGEQALAQFRADPDRFDLVLTDVVMPNRNGSQLAAELRRLRPDVRVLFMSGYAGGAPVNPIELPPGTPLLEKPFSLGELLQAVAALIGE